MWLLLVWLQLNCIVFQDEESAPFFRLYNYAVCNSKWRIYCNFLHYMMMQYKWCYQLGKFFLGILLRDIDTVFNSPVLCQRETFLYLSVKSEYQIISTMNTEEKQLSLIFKIIKNSSTADCIFQDVDVCDFRP